MACFLVPTTEAIVSTIVEKNVEAHEKKKKIRDKHFRNRVR